MQLYDGLPLNTPTKIDVASTPGDIDVWAIRTVDGGSIEYRPVPGGPTDLARQRDANITAAVATLRQWAIDARATTVTSGNAVATLQVVVNHLGTFFDRFADLLQALGKG